MIWSGSGINHSLILIHKPSIRDSVSAAHTAPSGASSPRPSPCTSIWFTRTGNGNTGVACVAASLRARNSWDSTAARLRTERLCGCWRRGRKRRKPPNVAAIAVLDWKAWPLSKNILVSRVSDPHWFNADPDTDPDPAFFLIADPDPGSGSRVWWSKIE